MRPLNTKGHYITWAFILNRTVGSAGRLRLGHALAIVGRFVDEEEQ
jgi:hypothetical protein